MHESSSCCAPLTTVGIIFFTLNILSVLGYHIVILIGFSIIHYEAKFLFKCLLEIWASSFVKYLFQSLAHLITF